LVGGGGEKKGVRGHRPSQNHDYEKGKGPSSIEEVRNGTNNNSFGMTSMGGRGAREPSA